MKFECTLVIVYYRMHLRCGLCMYCSNKIFAFSLRTRICYRFSEPRSFWFQNNVLYSENHTGGWDRRVNKWDALLFFLCGVLLVMPSFLLRVLPRVVSFPPDVFPRAPSSSTTTSSPARQPPLQSHRQSPAAHPEPSIGRDITEATHRRPDKP
jgi:hypothetical protein